jgi:putative polyhydroxyalkanoate system protein
MSDIRLSRAHALTLEEREQALSALVDYLMNSLNATVEQREGHVAFKGAGFVGHISLDPATVEGAVRLGIIMKPLKGVISKEIEKVLDQYLGAS